MDTLMPFLSRPTEAAAGPRRPGDERAALLAALERAGGNRSRAASLLGVSRKTFYARLKRLGIQLP
jgi:transcriptional regulator of acetoin/glycerol metabolism